MVINDEILEILKIVLIEQPAIRFFDVYKGMPVTYNGKLLAINQGQGIFQVHKYQATCIEVNRRAFFRCESLSSAVRGNVLKVDFLSDRVTLRDFAFVNTSIGNRTLTRVTPKEIIVVEIGMKGRTLFGEIADFSMGGIGVRSGAIYYDPRFFVLGARVTLKFELPTAKTPLILSGILANVKRERNYYRLGIRTHLDASVKGSISQYITQRQIEIQRELQLMHDLFVQLHTRSG